MIRNNNDLRIKYEALRMFIELAEEMGKQNDAKLQDAIKEYKKEIRGYLNRRNKQSLFRGTLVKDYGCDGLIEKIVVPFDIADAEIWFENEIYMPPINSAYDCTGRAFSGWHRIYKQGGRTVIYHRVCIDC